MAFYLLAQLLTILLVFWKWRSCILSTNTQWFLNFANLAAVLFWFRSWHDFMNSANAKFTIDTMLRHLNLTHQWLVVCIVIARQRHLQTTDSIWALWSLAVALRKPGKNQFSSLDVAKAECLPVFHRFCILRLPRPVLSPPLSLATAKAQSQGKHLATVIDHILEGKSIYGRVPGHDTSLSGCTVACFVHFCTSITDLGAELPNLVEAAIVPPKEWSSIHIKRARNPTWWFPFIICIGQHRVTRASKIMLHNPHGPRCRQHRWKWPIDPNGVDDLNKI